MEDPDTPIRRPSTVISAFGPSSLTTIENLSEEKNKSKNESLKTANDALRTRVCYVSQVVLFLVALVSLTIGLTVGYNKDETAGSNNQAEDSEASVSECPFDVAGDGFCDDQANIYQCEFDGGDCCMKEGNPINDLNCLQCMCLVTTTSTTTYSTTTTSTTQVEFDFCPDCPKNDTMIVAKEIDLAPIEIRSGDYKDCKEICYMMHAVDCYIFNFFTSDFEGPLKNTCVLFMQGEDKYTMKNVISGRGWDQFIYFDPGFQLPEPEPCTEYVDSYMASYNQDDYYLTNDEKIEVPCE